MFLNGFLIASPKISNSTLNIIKFYFFSLEILKCRNESNVIGFKSHPSIDLTYTHTLYKLNYKIVNHNEFNY